MSSSRKSLRKKKGNQKTSNLAKFQNYFAFGAIILSIGFVFSNILSNKILDFDDSYYFTTYYELINFNWSDLKTIFSSYYLQMYQPLPVLSFALTYKFFGAEPAAYHLFSIFFHMLNGIMVFLLVKKLFRNYTVSLLAALLFAVHPMNVETVSWISARSNEMFTFFFLLALYFYLEYSEKQTVKNYVLVVVFFLFSLLCKVQAVTFPIAILAIDWYDRRKINSRSVIEKVPLLLLSLIFGIIAILDPNASGYLDELNQYSFVDHIFLFTYSLAYYIFRFVFPFHLATINLYPLKTGGFFPIEYYLAPVFLLLVVWAAVRYGRKRRYILMGLSFFIITISVTLQIIPSRWIIVADRYTYLPYVGLLFAVAGLLTAIRNVDLIRKFAIGMVVYAFVFALISREQGKIWASDLSLWENAVSHYPDHGTPYKARGDARKNRGDVAGGIADYNKAIELDPQFEEAYCNRGDAKQLQSNFNGAIFDYNRALEIDSMYVNAYHNRGIAKLNAGMLSEAEEDFNRALEIDTSFFDCYFNRGFLRNMMEKYDLAVEDLNKNLYYFPSNPKAYYQLSLAKTKLGKTEEAIYNLTQCLLYDPQNITALNDRGVLYSRMEKNDEALADFSKVIALDNTFVSAYMNRGIVYSKTNQFQAALSDFKRAQALQPNDPEIYTNLGFLYLKMNDRANACVQFKTAENFGSEVALELVAKFCR